ncbi:MAG: response regulator, partial [Muribaculaceae bacterium]|nr:response regulator [Muribaculaceae bacterium]
TGANQDITILIIDDDAEILHLLHDSMAEFEIYTATNAQAGLKIVTDKNPDLIITDIMMAGEGGIWFTKKVKENRHTAHIPIVMLSAKSTSVDKIAGLKAGADAYVAKPFSTAYLLEVVKRLLSSRGELKDYYKSSASAFEYLDGKTLSQNDKEFMNRLKELVEESICDSELSADVLAEKMNMSLRNLYRKMKILQLPPPIDFIRQHRLKHAAHLLATTSIPIQDVFMQSGFNNRSYFYKEFDKVYGMTPRAYRIQKQEEMKNTPQKRDN